MEAVRPLTPPLNPGASSSVVAYDSGTIPLNQLDNKGARLHQRCTVCIFTDSTNTVIRWEWAAPGSSTLRLVQADVAVTASTFTQRDFRLQPGRNKISLVTGAGTPTVWDTAVELSFDRALAQ